MTAKMLNNKYKLIAAALVAMTFTSCSEDTEDDQEKQDQIKLDEAARKLDEQMPSARAERINNGTDETSVQ